MTSRNGFEVDLDWIYIDLSKRPWVSPGLVTEPLSQDRDAYRDSPRWQFCLSGPGVYQ